MPIEIEKKYRLTKRQRDLVLRRLPEIGATLRREEFEKNTIYGGGDLDTCCGLLRLRRLGDRAILTFKKSLPTNSPIKHRQEDQTSVDDADAMDAILGALGLTPALVYEKRRATWRLGQTEIAVDELPFGLFMEIEGTEAGIRKIERQLAIKGLKAELATYPALTLKRGRRYGNVIEARFED